MLDIVPTGVALGADITGVDLTKVLDEISFARIRKAFDQYGVLRFRVHDLSMKQLLVFADRSGRRNGKAVTSSFGTTSRPSIAADPSTQTAAVSCGVYN